MNQENDYRSSQTAQIDHRTGYINNIQDICINEYPTLISTTYLDHAGTTPYAKSLIQEYSQELTTNLFGNPHSASASSSLSSRRIDDVRLQVLRYFNANTDEFDVVFVANATAAIKLVGDALRDCDEGFFYNYHVESHTSLVGLRELAAHGSRCFSDEEADEWISQVGNNDDCESNYPCLFAYPAQSNMTGQRFPLKWCKQVQEHRRRSGKKIVTLLDGAALLSTSPLDLSDASSAPDFMALSFYKIFGFPDLGALIVRKESGEILRNRKYFGGGTVDMAIVGSSTWHAKKTKSIHSCVEDGTLPFHSIIALQIAMSVHQRLYGSMANVSNHANFLACKTREWMLARRHANGKPVFRIYGNPLSFWSAETQGPVVAFNLIDQSGEYISNVEVEKLATIQGIQFRTGGLCNPGGIKSYLNLSAQEMLQNYNAGQRCGNDEEIINGKPTGAIRVSFGGTNTLQDVKSFTNFIDEFYVEKAATGINQSTRHADRTSPSSPRFVIESLSVFPIKSCAAFKVPADLAWEVGQKGLAWDREWCLVHEGTGVALSQKRYPRMALLQPHIDLRNRILRIVNNTNVSPRDHIEISLDAQPYDDLYARKRDRVINRASSVCGEDVDVWVYTSEDISSFFTEILDVPCTLARFPADGSIRHASVRGPGRSSTTQQKTMTSRSISLSNESPILLVSRSSVNRLNELIKQNGSIGKAVAAASFRGNIVIAEDSKGGQRESPYIEDTWQSISHVSKDQKQDQSQFEVLGPCQRCQMICVDQKNAQRRQEPFSTLAKTRRRDGKVWFGMHLCLDSIGQEISERLRRKTFLQVGDAVLGHVS